MFSFLMRKGSQKLLENETVFTIKKPFLTKPSRSAVVFDARSRCSAEIQYWKKSSNDILSY
ncbi:MAG TPA: hypothetical protein DEB46_12180 [Myxococcales bacterium]|nr:hypothetical protein [Myxococcales bacterium]